MILPKKNKTQYGFTLIELLIVITIIGILSGILIAVLKPAFYISETRNARRREEVHTISLAIYQYNLSKGYPPAAITSTKTEICRIGAVSCAGLIDLSVLVDEYAQTLPVDPLCQNSNGTGFSVSIAASGRVTVSADLAENEQVIEITR